MSNNNLQANTLSALHNAVMEAGGNDRAPMLAPGIYGAPPTRPSRVMETYATISEENRKKIDAKDGAIQIFLTGIDNDIYSTVDAFPNAMEMWKAFERKFTSRDGGSLDSYYSRFVTIVKNNQDLKTISYYKLYDILKQHHNEVNEIRAERLTRNANPIALVAATQQPVYHPQPKLTHYNQSSSTKSQAATRNKGKEITNTPSLTYDLEPKAVSDEEATPRDKEIKKLMALISMSYKIIYKPTNNKLRTSSNTRNKNVDNTLRSDRRIGYDRQTRRYENQRTANVARARNNVGTQDITDKEERVLLASLIANLKLKIDENKKINKDPKKENMSLNSELTRYKESDYVKEADIEIANAYGLLKE
ncbi:hypothetical protein Tco_0505518 [Tanacetum coccineum]